MRLVWAVGLAALAASGFAGCKKGKSADKEPEQAAATAPHTAARPSLAKVHAKMDHQPRRIDPIAVADVVAVLPAPEGATVLTEPSKPEQGERVQAVYCFENTTPAEAAAKLQAVLESHGWINVHVRSQPDSPDRAAVAAQQPPYRASVSVRRVPAPKCNGAEGHSFATVTVHKISGISRPERAEGQQ